MSVIAMWSALIMPISLAHEGALQNMRSPLQDQCWTAPPPARCCHRSRPSAHPWSCRVTPVEINRENYMAVRAMIAR